ncbi:hypothetical protein ACK31Q_07270, partial [Aeromonas caviae]
EGDGGDQITKSSVSSIQAASIWATTPLTGQKRTMTVFIYSHWYLMEKQLEPAIAAMVADFIAAGRPKASQLSWQARRDGYLASALLGGER